MVGLDRAVLGRNRGAFDQGQQVALHAFARDVAAAAAAFAHADLVDLVEKHDAVVLDRVDRLLHKLIAVEQLVGFLVDQKLMGILNRQPARLGPSAHLAEYIAQRDGAQLCTRHARYFKHRQAAGGLRFDLYFLVIEFAGPQFLAEGIARGRAGIGADQRVEHAFLGGELGSGLNVLALALAGLRDRDLDEIADDLLDVAADVPDLGKFRGFDLDERRAREFGEPACDFGLADAGRPDHQDVLRQYFFAERADELQPPPAIAQRDGHRALGIGLADNKAIEFGDDFAGGEVGHGP